MSQLTVTRRVDDWVGVIQALKVMGDWNEGLIERIREGCRSVMPNQGPVTIVFEGRDVQTIDFATNAADRGRPSYFPPVVKNQNP